MTDFCTRCMTEYKNGISDSGSVLNEPFPMRELREPFAVATSCGAQVVTHSLRN